MRCGASMPRSSATSLTFFDIRTPVVVAPARTRGSSVETTPERADFHPFQRALPQEGPVVTAHVRPPVKEEGACGKLGTECLSPTSCCRAGCPSPSASARYSPSSCCRSSGRTAARTAAQSHRLCGRFAVVPDMDSDGLDDLAIGTAKENIVYLLKSSTGAVLDTIAPPSGFSGTLARAWQSSTTLTATAIGTSPWGTDAPAISLMPVVIYRGSDFAEEFRISPPPSASMHDSLLNVGDINADGLDDLVINDPLYPMECRSVDGVRVDGRW